MTAPPRAASTFEDSRRAWFVLAVACLSAALTGPGQTIGVSVFIDHFVEDLDLTRSWVSGAYLVGTLCGGLTMPFVGRFIDRRGVRLTQVIVGLAFAVALVNMAGVNGLLWLAIGFAGIRMLGQGALSLTSTVTVSLSFRRNRGFALGLFAVVSGALMAMTPVLMNSLIDEFGWRQTWLIAAAAVLGTVVPLGWFGLRSVPLPGGREPAVSDDRHIAGSATRAEAVRTRSFWMLAIVAGSAGMLGTALTFHQIDLLGEAGLSSGAAASMFIPQVLGSTVAGLSVGYLGDRVGTRYLPAAGMALLVLAHLLAAFVTPGLMVVVYAITLGAMGGTVRTATSTLLPTWFGTGHLGSIQGVLTLLNVFGSALGPFALAVVQAGFGSYRPAILLLMTLPAAAFMIAIDPRNQRPRDAEWMAPTSPPDERPAPVELR